MATTLTTSRASTPPAEERVTSFFTRVKKEVTKKESTLPRAPGLALERAGKSRRSRLRFRRGSMKGYQSSLRVSNGLLDGSLFPCAVLWTGKVRVIADLHGAKPGARGNVLSFGDFSLHEQRKVTRSAAGRVEALLFIQKRRQAKSKRIPAFAGMTNHQREPGPIVHWNDEPNTEIIQRPPSCVG